MDLVDLVLVMTVNPGFGGQSYIETMEPKIAEVAKMIRFTGRDIDLEVDGGIGPSTVRAPPQPEPTSLSRGVRCTTIRRASTTPSRRSGRSPSRPSPERPSRAPVRRASSHRSPSRRS